MVYQDKIFRDDHVCKCCYSRIYNNLDNVYYYKYYSKTIVTINDPDIFIHGFCSSCFNERYSSNNKYLNILQTKSISIQTLYYFWSYKKYTNDEIKTFFYAIL